MTRTLSLVCVALVLAFQLMHAGAGQEPGLETTSTLTATIEAIDKTNRTVTLKGPINTVVVKAPDEMEGFNSLRVGDQVVATYYEALAVNNRKPGEPAPSAEVTTTERKDRTPGSTTRRQQTFTVTIEAIDVKTPSIRVKGPKGNVASFAVRDPKRLQTLKVGDTVDVTYYESLLIKVARAQK